MKELSKKSLFLCATPLQAKICIEITRSLNLREYDIVYYTRNNSESDKYYFANLKNGANSAYYIFTPQVRKGLNLLLEIASLVRIDSSLLSDDYDEVYLASAEKLLFRKILSKNPSCSIIGFDDGTANITPNSSYYNQDNRLRTKLTDYVFKTYSSAQIRQNYIKNYSIYPNFDNILDKDRTEYLNIFNFHEHDETKVENQKSLVFFIGQPFDEYLTNEEMTRLKKWLEQITIDYYVLHPREKSPLLGNCKVLNKQGLLAEDAIIMKARDRPIHIIAGYSTVLFNIPGLNNIKKTYISVSSSPDETIRRSLIHKTNTTIEKI